MSPEPSLAPVALRVRTDAAFAHAVHAASVHRNWSRPTLAAQAHVPLTAIHALHRCAPVQLDAVSAVCRCLALPLPRFLDLDPLLKLGRLLRDRRARAGLSRKALGRMAKLSDATVKFIETAVHAPSRATCLRLLSVAALELTWADLTPFAGPPPEPSHPLADLPVFRLDPRLSIEMIREQTLLIDQLRLHQYGLESSLTGWRRFCRLCGARSREAAVPVEQAQHLPLGHHGECTVQLAEALVRRYPILQELAQTERHSRLTLTAQRLHRGLQQAPERMYGCRSAQDLGEQLAHASAAPASPYHRGVASVLLWALDLGPCPPDLSSDSFTEDTARNLLAVLSDRATAAAQPVELLRGIAETAAWILDLHALSPQAFSESEPHPSALSDAPCPSSGEQ